MARPKSDLVSAMGTSFEIFKALAEEVYSLGGDDNDLRRIIKERKLRRELGNLLVTNPSEVFRLDVFGLSIDELVKQGRYYKAHPDINYGNFKADEMHQCEVVLRHFCKDMSTNAVLKALDEENQRAATMSELLELGIRYPELQKRFLIVALGSACHGMFGDCYVGYLYYDDGQRSVGLNLVDHDWDNGYHFAAVRK